MILKIIIRMNNKKKKIKNNLIIITNLLIIEDVKAIHKLEESGNSISNIYKHRKI